MKLDDCYQKNVVVTAHRGFSGNFPENTLLAFQKAMELGVDLIEFDLRGTKDHVPVVLHDATIDRTSDGTGPLEQFTLAEVRRFNFSHFFGPYHEGEHREEPAFPDVTIPTFQEVLELAAGRVCMNIQVYDASPAVLPKICELYRQYDLYEQAYLSMSTFADGQAVRELDPAVELCILEDRVEITVDRLQRQKQFGVQYYQPRRKQLSPDICRLVNDMGFRSNVFYSNTDEDNRQLIEWGQQGILTDRPDVLLETIQDLGLA
ncbi:MAG: hypothetical protein JXA11_10180 [Phycisphaerae bacterium]|nr:hypothetical protein [Phycisphaerae bacterium]